MDPGLRSVLDVLVIVVPGFFVGWLALDSVRKIFSEDDRLLPKLFADQPVTMIATVTTVGAVLVWGLLRILGLR